MTAIFRLPYLVAMMSELLKQIQNGRLAIDELDHFYIEAKRVIAICEKIRSLFFPERVLQIGNTMISSKQYFIYEANSFIQWNQWMSDLFIWRLRISSGIAAIF